jgi:hypothetical protein
MFDDLLGPMKPYIPREDYPVDQENDVTDPGQQVSADLRSAPVPGRIPGRGWTTGRPQKRPWRTT